MSEDDPQTQVLMIVELVARIRPLLAGRPPPVQGAVLAELLSIWLAGHHPAQIREPLLQAHLQTVRSLIPVNERSM